MITVSMTINDKKVGPMEVDNSLMMIDFLHHYMNLTGTKFGCGAGICHACVVIVEDEEGNSETLRTCINGVGRFNGKRVRTVEGHAKRNRMGQITSLSPIQETFATHFSFQCGWCTSGFINASTVLIEKLKKEPISSDQVEATIEEALNNHICRCSGYRKYYEGLKDFILSTDGLIK